MDDDLGPGVPGDERGERNRRLLKRFGTAIAVVLIAGGLAVVGFIVLLVVSLNSWSSNK